MSNERDGMPEFVIPRWTLLLMAGIVTEASHFRVVVRAWGPGMKSERMWNGELRTLDDLKRLMDMEWPVEGGVNLPACIHVAGIDLGHDDRVLDIDRMESVLRIVTDSKKMTAFVWDESQESPFLFRRVRVPDMLEARIGTIPLYIQASNMKESAKTRDNFIEDVTPGYETCETIQAVTAIFCRLPLYGKVDVDARKKGSFDEKWNQKVNQAHGSTGDTP